MISLAALPSPPPHIRSGALSQSHSQSHEAGPSSLCIIDGRVVRVAATPTTPSRSSDQAGPSQSARTSRSATTDDKPRYAFTTDESERDNEESDSMDEWQPPSDAEHSAGGGNETVLVGSQLTGPLAHFPRTLGRQRAAASGVSPHRMTSPTSGPKGKGRALDGCHSHQTSADSSAGISSSPSRAGFVDVLIDNYSRISQQSALEKESGSTSPKRKKRYACSWEGCDKTYTKPCRLEEHFRVHTGDRPFKCSHPGCDQSYMRESHLSAHMRTHLSPNTKAHACPVSECSKRFWTTQHVRRHVALCHAGSDVEGGTGEGGRAGAEDLLSTAGEGTDAELNRERERAYKCSEPGCEAAFSKRKRLRAHMRAAHIIETESSLPFACAQAGCDKRFPTVSKRKTHMRTHETGRYTCAYPHDRPQHQPEGQVCPSSHANSSNIECAQVHMWVFDTWSALQAHIRSDHPPTCPRPECAGKTFKRAENLAAHLRRHEQRDADAAARRELLAGSAGADAELAQDSVSDGEAEMSGLRGGMEGRDYACEEAGCPKAFKSAYALSTHVRTAHLGERPFGCPHEGCTKRYGHKHLLKAHSRRCALAPLSPALRNREEGERGEGAGSDGDDEEMDTDDELRAEGGAVPERVAERGAAPRRRALAPMIPMLLPHATRTSAKRKRGEGGEADRTSMLDLLTGHGYGNANASANVSASANGNRASPNDDELGQEHEDATENSAGAASLYDGKKRLKTRGRVLGCPWAQICSLRSSAGPSTFSAAEVPTILMNPEPAPTPTPDHEPEPEPRCEYRFSRLYDLRRHLASAHSLILGDEEIRAVVPREERMRLAASRRAGGGVVGAGVGVATERE